MKFFRDGIGTTQKRQVLKSLRRILPRRPVAWTLVVPVNLTTPALRWFEDEVRAIHPEITMTLWQGDEILRRMREASLIDLYLLPPRDKIARAIDPAVVDRHREKVQRTTATFYVPLLRSDIGSQHAYSVVVPREVRSSDSGDDDDELDRGPVALKSFADELQQYHEPVDRSWRKETDALKVIRRRRLVVIVGGPGGGKRTLCLKIAHVESLAGRSAFFVRPRVCGTTGKRILDTALRRVAAPERRRRRGVSTLTSSCSTLLTSAIPIEHARRASLQLGGRSSGRSCSCHDAPRGTRRVAPSRLR